jgi:putative transposase
MSADTTKKAGSFYRRHLPHWQPPTAAIFVTFRLAGSLPSDFVEALTDEKENIVKQALLNGRTKEEIAVLIHKLLFQRIDQALAEVLKSDHCSVKLPKWLSNLSIAKTVRDALHYWDDRRYKLHRYVIMPNHVHILIEPLEITKNDDKDGQANNLSCVYQLSKIMQGLKGYSARKANEILRRKGKFWHDESFDHWIRSQGELEETCEYIDMNPVKAGLCKKPEDWRWSSAGEM